jgi:hypothetical protein
MTRLYHSRRAVALHSRGTSVGAGIMIHFSLLDVGLGMIFCARLWFIPAQQPHSLEMLDAVLVFCTAGDSSDTHRRAASG